MKILILGGYGVFGGRLAELIQDLPVLVLIAGRSAAKSTAFCKTLFGAASFEPIAQVAITRWSNVRGAIRWQVSFQRRHPIAGFRPDGPLSWFAVGR